MISEQPSFRYDAMVWYIDRTNAHDHTITSKFNNRQVDQLWAILEDEQPLSVFYSTMNDQVIDLFWLNEIVIELMQMIKRNDEISEMKQTEMEMISEMKWNKNGMKTQLQSVLWYHLMRSL